MTIPRVGSWPLWSNAACSQLIEVNHTHRGALISERRPGKLLHTEYTSAGEAAWCIVWVDGRMRFVPPDAVESL